MSNKAEEAVASLVELVMQKEQLIALLERDAERYRAIRVCGVEWGSLPVFDNRGALIPEALDEAADALCAAIAKGEGK